MANCGAATVTLSSDKLWSFFALRQPVLRSLLIKNFALVDSLEVTLEPGLTVITGESGAGKSIILGALGLVLGNRAAAEAIRPAAANADVTAEFDCSGRDDAQAFLGEHSLVDPDQPNRCLVRRVVSREGRSRAFINGTPATLRMLRELTSELVDVHGQHENQRLVQPAVQLALLDDYGVDPATRDACRRSYRAWQQALRQADELEARLASKQDRASLLTYQLEELNALGLAPGELEALESDHKRLSQVHALREVVARSLSELEDLDTLGRLCRDLQAIDDDHPSLGASREMLTSAAELTRDALKDLRSYEQSLEADPETLATLDERLSGIMDLARKHHVPPPSLPDHIEALRTELGGISTDHAEFERATTAVNEHEADYRMHAAEVSRQRRAAADGFCAAVGQCMDTLGITGGRLNVVFHDRESEQGTEAVEFHVVTNPNYPPAPLAKIASGGEQTRISLAIQVVAAEQSALPCLVLDEADVGVGGTTADVIGRLLRSLAGHTQVLCITHAPQVAALGQHHLRVLKSVDQRTLIEPVVNTTRIDELARMLAGSDITDKSRDYAKTLLEDAGQALH